MPDINYLRIQIWYHDVPHKIVEKKRGKKQYYFEQNTNDREKKTRQSKNTKYDSRIIIQ